MPLDRLAAAGDPQLRRVLLHARSQRHPLTAHEVSLALDIHRNVARSRLDRLAAAGFLTVSPERRGRRGGPGAGRPANVYRVAPELDAVEFPDRRLAELIGLLVGKLPPDAKAEVLREAGKDFGRSLAAAARLRASGNVGTGLQRVCDALGSLGFQASVRSLDRHTAILETATCPLRPLVAKWPEAEGIDCGMWAGLAERGIRGASASLIQCETPHCRSADAPCTVLLLVGRQESEAPARD